MIKDENNDSFKELENRARYADIFEGQQKKIQCTRELIFNITARLMSENSEGQDIACEELMIKNFHIPVPEGNDYKSFMDAFFSFLEKKLAESAKHAYSLSSENTGNEL